MHRYGEPDFDAEYMKWGFHNLDTQLKEAESILKIVGAEKPLQILDLACGIGTHAIHWAKQGHDVTAIDISKTFLDKARRSAFRENVDVGFVRSDMKTLSCKRSFDVVTWIEVFDFDRKVVEKVHTFLRKGGLFIFDVRNPENPKAKARQGNWRTWREENGVFFLEKHETDPDTGQREDLWITINSQREIIEERAGFVGIPLSLADKVRLLKKAGFRNVELRTMEGILFDSGQEPYWLWVVAEK